MPLCLTRNVMSCASSSESTTSVSKKRIVLLLLTRLTTNTFFRNTRGCRVYFSHSHSCGSFISTIDPNFSSHSWGTTRITRGSGDM